MNNTTPILINVEADGEYAEKYSLPDRDRKGELFDEYDKDALSWADRVYYHYFSEAYEGSGDALILCNGKRGAFSLGHCSCYGPLEGISQERCDMTFDEALGNTLFSPSMKAFIEKDWK